VEALAQRDIDLLLRTKKRVADIKRAFKPDLIHVHFTDPSVFFHLQTENTWPAPFLLSFRVGLPPRSFGPEGLLGKSLCSADWVTANSQAVLKESHRLYPQITPYSSTIYNGMEIPKEPICPLPVEKPRLLCLGRLETVKGFDLALTSFAAIVSRFPEARLVIAGDGSARSELERQSIELGITNNVEFIGWVNPDEIWKHLNACTVVLMPSRWEEAFGLVAVEAGLMARPVVATRVGGLPEVVVDGETGLLVEKEDAHALARATEFLLDHPNDAARMGLAGRLRTEDLFNLDRYVDEYDLLYQKLAARRPLPQIAVSH
jgi:glycogen(starch) synthase